MTPSVAPVVEVEFGGEKRTLKFGFLAYREMGLNPFDPASVEAFQARGLDIDMAATVIRAGLLHEYFGKSAVRKGQTPPSVDDIVADLDMFVFVPLWGEIEKAIGTDKEAPKQEQDPNPPSA